MARIAIALALVPYLGALALVGLAASGADISRATAPYFIVSVAACIVSCVLAVIGKGRWSLALALIYLLTTGLVVGVLSQLA